MIISLEESKNKLDRAVLFIKFIYGCFDKDYKLHLPVGYNNFLQITGWPEELASENHKLCYLSLTSLIVCVSGSIYDVYMLLQEDNRDHKLYWSSVMCEDSYLAPISLSLIGVYYLGQWLEQGNSLSSFRLFNILSLDNNWR
jgi:hypothetical protein